MGRGVDETLGARVERRRWGLEKPRVSVSGMTAGTTRRSEPGRGDRIREGVEEGGWWGP